MPITPALAIPAANVVTALLPAVAMFATRRSWRAPAGHAALAWAVVSVQAAVNLGVYVAGVSLPTRALLTCIGTILYLVVLLPHTLEWMGRPATRWYWPLVAAWLTACAVAFATLGAGREFRTVMAPISGVLMCFVTGTALASRVKRAPNAPRLHDWYWILTGQILFFSVEIFRKPITEVLMARHWDVMVAASYSFTAMYSVCHVMVAWGVLHRAPVTPPRSFPPASLASPV